MTDNTKNIVTNSGNIGKKMLDDRHSPYYLSSSDNPRVLLTHIQLKCENYEEWARVFKGSLRAKTKTKFIDGTIPLPSDDDETKLWWIVNSMIVSWIFNTIEPNFCSSVTYVAEAKVLWDNLKERFSVDNELRTQRIKSSRSDIANCIQGKNEIVAAYQFVSMSICSCTGCNCNIGATLAKKREDERVHQFVMGLETPKFENVKSFILRPNLCLMTIRRTQ